ncbi:glycosyltransferase family 4 protein [Arthrobacter sp. LjRoot78]|uniref:glycosyltransferase family 4 protein n=1 Tax=Arthrobacter sp. LjRoot78 TaxID=3342338 RepID=UPI003ED12F56
MRVAIIHPWLPQYRVGFFRQLIAQGRDKGVEINVFYGETPPEWQERRDTMSAAGFTKLETHFISVNGGRSFNRKDLAAVERAGQNDLIIVEQAVRNLETYELLMRREPLAFWGHGKTYTKKVSRLQDWFKQWLTRRGSWFFAYTPVGAEAMANSGMAREKITVVQNSIDTRTLREDLSNVDRDSLASFKMKHDLRGKTALFVGGLDRSKRLPFLFEAATEAARLDPDFRLLVAGSGDDQELAELAAAANPNVRYLGPVFGSDKALAIAASQVIAMPGRVGLVAVDSFTGLTPIVTTQWKWHSVEFEYLEPYTNAVITEDAVDAYARGLVETLQNEKLMASLRDGCAEAREKYTLDTMVSNFLNGVISALEMLRK